MGEGSTEFRFLDAGSLGLRSPVRSNSAGCRRTMRANYAVSADSPLLCSNPDLDASHPLRVRLHRGGARVRASHCQQS
jgi:hypothetical protein